mmetsp:Transcript_43493/g.72488  ORF Transcript_43493/g.72488 Transcript_43493/m.72488 type:complete len:205 (-) Transcript_43493:223-837(-)
MLYPPAASKAVCASVMASMAASRHLGSLTSHTSMLASASSNWAVAFTNRSIRDVTSSLTLFVLPLTPFCSRYPTRQVGCSARVPVVSLAPSCPVMAFSRVDLPVPLGPTIAQRSPFISFRSTCSIRSLFPIVTVAPSMRSIAPCEFPRTAFSVSAISVPVSGGAATHTTGRATRHAIERGARQWNVAPASRGLRSWCGTHDEIT